MHGIGRLVVAEVLPQSPIFTTADIAHRVASSPDVVSRSLGQLAAAGVLTRLTRGLWANTNHPDFSAYAVVPFLTRPQAGLPAPDTAVEAVAGWDIPIALGDAADASTTDADLPYVSFVSALHLHGMLAQIPREIHVATRKQRPVTSTPVAKYVFHQIGPDLYGGARAGDRWGRFQLATPAKGVVDTLYLSVRRQRQFSYLPEIDLPYAPLPDHVEPSPYALPTSETDRLQELDAEVRRWIERVEFRRLRTAVTSRWKALHQTMRAAI